MLKDQLRKARKDAGKTQKEVAAFIGVTESAYCGYETGKRQPDALKIKKIAAFLNVTGDYLLETDKAEARPAVTCESPDEIHLISCYRSLNNIGKTAAIAAIDGLAANPSMQKEPSASQTA